MGSGAESYLKIAMMFSSHLPLAWTFFLLLTRFGAMILLLPGIGGGPNGMAVRLPTMVLCTLTVVGITPPAPLPADMGMAAYMFLSEVLFGAAVGYIPVLLIASVQTGASLASTAMGMGAGSLFDPTLQTSVGELSKLLGDLTVIIFLLLDGHHLVIRTIAGVDGTIIPGTFLIGDDVLKLLIDRSAHLFLMATMIAAPVIVALMLTQLVMGLVSRAVPTINVFMFSFPLTIGIGILLTIVAIPDIFKYVGREMTSLESSIDVVTESTTRIPAETPAKAARAPGF